MSYRLYNLNYKVASDLIDEFGSDIYKNFHFADEGCVDMYLDASLIILKINDAFITIDKGGKLFTISPDDYQMLCI